MYVYNVCMKTCVYVCVYKIDYKYLREKERCEFEKGRWVGGEGWLLTLEMLFAIEKKSTQVYC